MTFDMVPPTAGKHEASHKTFPHQAEDKNKSVFIKLRGLCYIYYVLISYKNLQLLITDSRSIKYCMEIFLGDIFLTLFVIYIKTTSYKKIQIVSCIFS